MSHTIWEFVYGTNVIINKMYIQRRLHKQKTQNQKKHKTKENTGDLHVNNSTADPTESFIVIKMYYNLCLILLTTVKVDGRDFLKPILNQ